MSCLLLTDIWGQLGHSPVRDLYHVIFENNVNKRCVLWSSIASVLSLILWARIFHCLLINVLASWRSVSLWLQLTAAITRRKRFNVRAVFIFG